MVGMDWGDEDRARCMPEQFFKFSTRRIAQQAIVAMAANHNHVEPVFLSVSGNFVQGRLAARDESAKN